jgi:hypothetical protein
VFDVFENHCINLKVVLGKGLTIMLTNGSQNLKKSIKTWIAMEKSIKTLQPIIYFTKMDIIDSLSLHASIKKCYYLLS